MEVLMYSNATFFTFEKKETDLVVGLQRASHTYIVYKMYTIAYQYKKNCLRRSREKTFLNFVKLPLLETTFVVCLTYLFVLLLSEIPTEKL